MPSEDERNLRVKKLLDLGRKLSRILGSYLEKHMANPNEVRTLYNEVEKKLKGFPVEIILPEKPANDASADTLEKVKSLLLEVDRMLNVYKKYPALEKEVQRLKQGHNEAEEKRKQAEKDLAEAAECIRTLKEGVDNQNTAITRLREKLEKRIPKKQHEKELLAARQKYRKSGVGVWGWVVIGLLAFFIGAGIGIYVGQLDLLSPGQPMQIDPLVSLDNS